MLLSLMIAKAQGVGGQALNELGLGALFHDIGMLRVAVAMSMRIICCASSR